MSDGNASKSGSSANTANMDSLESGDDFCGWGDRSDIDLKNPLQWMFSVLDSIREMHDPTLYKPSFHVAVTVHGRSLTDYQIDVLSIYGYVVRLGTGSRDPHNPIVVSRFVDSASDGVEDLAQAVGRAHMEVSAALQQGQYVFAVHAMAEEQWYECEQCRENTLNEYVGDNDTRLNVEKTLTDGRPAPERTPSDLDATGDDIVLHVTATVAEEGGWTTAEQES